LTRELTAMLVRADVHATSGASAANASGHTGRVAEATTTGGLMYAKPASVAPYAIHVNTTPGTIDTSVLPSSSSTVATGVASSGSSVRSTFSPMTACEATVEGSAVATMSNIVRNCSLSRMSTAVFGSRPSAQ